MKRTVRALMIAAVLSGLAGPAVAQERTAAGRITVEYAPSVFLGVNAAVKREHVLEELQAVLAPLRLPRDLKITMADCGAMKSPYRSGQPVKICYELINQIADAAKKLYPTDEGEQDVVIVGAIIQACFHEVAFAIFDILQVPIWGRADDAADRLAALIMVALGEDIEKVAILGHLRAVQMVGHLRQDLDRIELRRRGLARRAALFQLYLHRGSGRFPRLRRPGAEGHDSTEPRRRLHP